MKRYIVYMDCNIVGCDEIMPLLMHDSHTQKELDDAVWEMVCEYGEGWQPDDMDWEDFVQDLSGHAELYDPDKHDMDRAGGGSFEDDFESIES